MPVTEEREKRAVAHAETALGYYKGIGPPGAFGAAMIEVDLSRYRRAKERNLDIEAAVVELEEIEM